MGFDSNGVKLLIKAKKLNVNFEKVITIGRQGLHLEHNEMQKLLYKSGYKNINSKILFEDNNYAEAFLKILGANIIDSLDASQYEGASVIHDMNIPIKSELKSKYTLVIDGGSLEHIFNFPIAIKNCMELIQKNGFYIGITPTNNFFGHGFYQFSPELYYRIFNEENGFKVIKMYLYIERKETPIYEVLDPNDVKKRITMINSYPTYLFVIAQKNENKNPFELTPQQSDYEQIRWKEDSSINYTKNLEKIRWYKRIIPLTLKILTVKLYFKIINSLKLHNPSGISNSKFITKIKFTYKEKKVSIK